MSDFATVWEKLPADVANGLLLSAAGEARLMWLGERLLGAAGASPDPCLFSVLAHMVLSAWECSPLSPGIASHVHALQKKQSFLRPQPAAFSAVCAGLRPENSSGSEEVRACIQAGDAETAKKLTSAYADREPKNLYWLHFASFLGIRMGELDWYEPWIARYPMPAAFSLFFLADYAFAREDYAKAAALYAQSFILSAMPEGLVREGECLFRMGDRDAAGDRLRKAIVLRPWQSNLLLRLADIESGADIPGDQPPGRGEVLIYSWNNGSALEQCLTALAASRAGNYGFTVLNNGSTDNTPDVLRSKRELFGERMRVITLPVNIGSPAARNWLLSLESSRAADWVVFLDDDALVPPDWVGFFGTAVRRHPDAGIIGCRVVDGIAPLALQSVGLFLETNKEGKYKFIDDHVNSADFGLNSYLRRAISVTGCCHLLSRQNIDSVGAFDLSFSPSQYDDAERDLRSCSQGEFCLYQGHLRVRHCKRRAFSLPTPWQQVNVMGNELKLWASYPEATLAAIMQKYLRRLKDDFVRAAEECL
jgi:GT2 family glycosyltransferase